MNKPKKRTLSEVRENATISKVKIHLQEVTRETRKSEVAQIFFALELDTECLLLEDVDYYDAARIVGSLSSLCISEDYRCAFRTIKGKSGARDKYGIWRVSRRKV